MGGIGDRRQITGKWRSPREPAPLLIPIGTLFSILHQGSKASSTRDRPQPQPEAPVPTPLPNLQILTKPHHLPGIGRASPWKKERPGSGCTGDRVQGQSDSQKPHTNTSIHTHFLRQSVRKVSLCIFTIDANLTQINALSKKKMDNAEVIFLWLV